jgi:hypothetical protein
MHERGIRDRHYTFMDWQEIRDREYTFMDWNLEFRTDTIHSAEY